MQNIRDEYLSYFNKFLESLNDEDFAKLLKVYACEFEIFDVLNEIIWSKIAVYPRIEKQLLRLYKFAGSEDEDNYVKYTGMANYYRNFLAKKYFFLPKGSVTSDLASIPRDVEIVEFSAFLNEIKWYDLRQLVGCDKLQLLNLGHDGVIYGTREDVIAVFDLLPSLKYLCFCGYYSQCDEIIKEEASKRNICVYLFL